MKYRALRTVYGDFGKRDPGDIFDVPDDVSTLRNMRDLEAKGVVQRHITRPVYDRKAYQVVQNKAIVPPLNKARP